MVWTVRRLHKWMSVAVGVFVFGWVVTGLVMIIPGPDESGGPAAPVDYAALAITPAAAVRTVEASSGVPAGNLRLGRLGDRIVYVVSPRDRPPQLVDAASGALVSLTPELAGELARHRLPATVRVTSVTRIERHSLSYHGPLPAYRVDFDDARGTRAYVNAVTGEVQRNGRFNRFKGLFASLHLFQPLDALPGGSRARKAALWLTSGIVIGISLTGYWLALPRRWRQERESGTGNRESGIGNRKSEAEP